MATYTTAEALASYAGSAIEGDSDDVERLLKQAERDIDSLWGQAPALTNGLKWDPTKLDDHQRLVLSNAACAQALYRQEMGPLWWIRPQLDSTSGPEGSQTGRLSRISPQTLDELIGGGLMRTTGKVGSKDQGLGPWEFQYGDSD